MSGMRIDLHVHSSISPCSRLSVADILAHARARGLDGVCVTDHDTMDIRFAVREGLQPDGLLLLFGMEYATAQGDFLVFGPFEELVLEPGLPAEVVLPLVHKAGGAVVAAHPCRKLRPADELMAKAGLVHCVERVNGRNREAENRQAATWAPRLPATAGSDAHRLEELGRAPTRFEDRIRDRAGLIAALKKGRCAPALKQGMPLFSHDERANMATFAP